MCADYYAARALLFDQGVLLCFGGYRAGFGEAELLEELVMQAGGTADV